MLISKNNHYWKLISLFTRYYSSKASLSGAYLKNVKPYDQIPGPRSFFETLRLMALPFSKYYKKPFTEIVRMMRTEYGNLVYFPGFMGSKPMIMTFLPEDNEKVYRLEGKWPYRRHFDTMVYFREKERPEKFPVYGGLIIEQGLKWYEIRTKVNQILMQPKNVKIYIPGLDNIAVEFVKKIRDSRNTKMEVPDNFFDNLNEWALENIAFIALDTKLNLLNGENPEARRLYELMKEIFRLTFEFEVRPSIWKYYQTPAFRKLMKFFDEAHDIMFDHVEKAMKRYEQDQSATENESILKKLLKVDKNMAKVMAVDMIGSGIDTISSTTAGVLYCLAKNPDKQELLRKEIMTILPSTDAKLNEKSFDNAPYMRAVLRESMRMFPTFVGNGRTLDQDIVLQGYQIPKGTDILMMETANTDVDEPDKFMPERWLKNHAQICPHLNEIHPFMHLPFGNGPRMCIGRRIAEKEIETLLTRMLREFKLEWERDDLKWDSHSINVPAGPFKIKISDL